MLIMQLYPGQGAQVGEDGEVIFKILEVNGKQVHVGIKAEKHMSITKLSSADKRLPPKHSNRKFNDDNKEQ